MKEPTHASFFSGVGGLDLGLERAGWRTFSFSEIDPYAIAVLAERWPGVPNLGSITDIASGGQGEWSREFLRQHSADLWSGGFPCQDLSVAGKRRGMVEGTRSNLAHAFLDLVERHRPPAILLENVPGLLSSHRGRDMATLLGRMGELGYGVAYRILDARHFGVPQRRRRVFILGLRSGPDDPTGRVAAERAAAVLAVGSRCPRHPAAGIEAGPILAPGLTRSIGNTGGHSGIDDANLAVAAAPIGPSPDSRGVRAADGLAGRMDDRPQLVNALGQRRGGPDDNEARAGHLVAFDYLNSGAAFGDNETGNLPTRQGWSVIGADTMTDDDPLLPLGLDSHRYRCCGNGVVAPVAEWIGRQLLAAL